MSTIGVTLDVILRKIPVGTIKVDLGLGDLVDKYILLSLVAMISRDYNINEKHEGDINDL